MEKKKNTKRGQQFERGQIIQCVTLLILKYSMTNKDFTFFPSKDGLFRSINPHIYGMICTANMIDSFLYSIYCGDCHWSIKNLGVSTSVISKVFLLKRSHKLMPPEMECD